MTQNLATLFGSPQAAFQARMGLVVEDLRVYPAIDLTLVQQCACKHEIPVGNDLYECPIATALWSAYMCPEAVQERINADSRAGQEYQRLRTDAPV